MPQLTGGAVVALMHQAGFPPSAWRVGAAIAYAESSWRTELTNQNTDSHRSKDLGLWQINDYWHPTELAQGSWKNPLDNTKMAYKLWKKTGQHGKWNSWVTYDRGLYKRHLSKADQAINEHRMKHEAAGESPDGSASAVDTQLSGETGGSAGGQFQNVGFSEELDKLARAVEIMTSAGTWIRIGIGVLGALLIGFGLVRLGADLPGVKKATGVVANFIPGGKLLKGSKRSRKRSGGRGQSATGDALDSAKESVKDAYDEMKDSGE